MYAFRNVASHLYGTDDYYRLLRNVYELFDEPTYKAVQQFILQVVESIEDGTFEEKYGVPVK